MNSIRKSLLIPLVGLSSWAVAQDKSNDLSTLPLEELMKMEVTTSSKKAEPFFNTPAAIYVVTQDEIKASGARNIPDLLRGIPGITVQQTQSNQWQVASRGFIDTFTNKLLVLIDGRSIYTPSYGGVYWATQDLLLDDIERIEVIRGPGGSLWGANAVNGIINIITKSADKTLGSYAEAGYGDLDRTVDALRYGSKIGSTGALRVYTKYREFAETHYTRKMLDQGDAGSDRRAGFRYDDQTDSHHLTLEGDISGQHFGETPYVADPVDELVPRYTAYNPTAYNILGHLSRTRGTTEDSAQVYFDHASRNVIDMNEVRDTFDAEIQRSQNLKSGNAVFGVGYRISKDRTDGSKYFLFDPASTTLNYLSAFGQLEKPLAKTFQLTLGTKFERNDYTGWEIQPSIRLSHTPDASHMYWASVTRAVRTPTRFDRDSYDAFDFDTVNNGYIAYVGGKNFDSERMIAYELGARFNPSRALVLDFAGFYNRYTNLRATVPGTPYLDPRGSGFTIFPNIITNAIQADTAGFEMYGKWTPDKDLKIWFSYAYFAPRLTLDPGASFDPTINVQNTPRHQFSWLMDRKLDDRLTIGLGAYFQDFLKRYNDTFWRLDMNARYELGNGYTATMAIQGATKPYRQEGQTTDFTYTSKIPRNFFIGIQRRF